MVDDDRTDLSHDLIARINGGRYGNSQILLSKSIEVLHAPVLKTEDRDLRYAMGWAAWRFCEAVNDPTAAAAGSLARRKMARLFVFNTSFCHDLRFTPDLTFVSLALLVLAAVWGMYRTAWVIRRWQSQSKLARRVATGTRCSG